MQTTYKFVKNYPLCMCIALIYWMVASASAQLSFIPGVDTSASPNANYAAMQYYNFSNAGGTGEFATGTQNNLSVIDYVTWYRPSYSFTYNYSPTYTATYIFTAGEGIGSVINAPASPPTELQITDYNTGIGHLILTLTSINSTSDGTENFAPGTTWSAANGANLQAYLDSPTLFSSGFTLYGTITLDASANSVNYGDNLNSLIQFNLTSVPEPSSLAIMVSGLGLLGAICSLRKK